MSGRRRGCGGSRAFGGGGIGGLYGLATIGLISAFVAGCGGAGTAAKPVSKGTSPGVRVVRPSPTHHVAENGAAAPYPGHCDAPALIAHRGETGDGAHLPENTWQAEVAAAAEGATYLNVDVRWTRDGVPVALHDPTVNRTTSEPRANVPITELTARQYTALDARDYVSDTSSGRVDPNVHPDTLAELLAKIAPTGKPIVVQMEADPFLASEVGGSGALGGFGGVGGSGASGRSAGSGASDSSADRDFANLAQVIQDSHYADRVIVAGWTLPDLGAFHAIAPNVTLAYLFESIGAKKLPTAAQLYAVDTHILYLDYLGVTAVDVMLWRAQGLQIWAWTPSQRTQWQKLTGDGVEAIATNWSRNYLKWAPVPCPADSSD